MCSVIIFSKPDNNHEDLEQDWKKFKAGDVIDIHEKDNFYWGDDSQGPNAHGWWTVVVVDSTQRRQLEHLLESGPLPLVSLTPLSAAEVKHQKRMHRVDLSKITSKMTREDFLAAVYAVPESISTNVIG